ncbi:MAG: T9SS type A sorting domain-containing protein [Bacteroidetes bacterium]|nr:T9SS type A sorting domain-containing protein [Bacteroidota bacterium]
MIILSFQVHSQEWIRIFGDNKSEIGSSVIETYDKGYVIGGYIMPDHHTPLYGWIIKTDINGGLLWDKKIHNDSFWAPINDIQQTNDGGYIISGSTREYDPAYDPFILKLNACGEMEWCKIYNTPENMDFAVRIFQLDDGGYISLFWYYACYNTRQRMWLFRLDKDGELLWNKVYRDTLSSTINENCNDLLITKDKNYVLTGFIDHEDEPGSNWYWIKPYWAIIDKDGDQWDQTIWWAFTQYHGFAYDSEEDSFSNIYSCGENHYNLENFCPVLFKLAPSGDTLWHKDLIENTEHGSANVLNLYNDSTIVIGGGWNYPGNECCDIALIKTDTLGNVLKIKILKEDVYAPVSMIKTFDGKIVVIDNFVINGTNWDLYMFKVNADLEYDTIYTQPFTYDSLCPHPIVSDTIEMDCDVVVNIPEEPEKEYTAPLKIWPNPAIDEIHIKLPEYIVNQQKNELFNVTHFNHQYQEKAALQFYDIFGRKVYELILTKGQKEVVVNVSFLVKGIYIIRLLYNGSQASTGKFVKE